MSRSEGIIKTSQQAAILLPSSSLCLFSAKNLTFSIRPICPLERFFDFRYLSKELREQTTAYLFCAIGAKEMSHQIYPLLTSECDSTVTVQFFSNTLDIVGGSLLFWHH